MTFHPVAPSSGSGGSTIQPWQFLVTSTTYGAKGNGTMLQDGAMSATSKILTSASANFTANDVGKAILVIGAGTAIVTMTGGGLPLISTIASVQSTTQVTLADASVNAVSGAGVLYGTDDTAAIQAAINAAVSYASANDGYCEVLFPPQYYILAAAPVVGGGTLGNSQLTLPVITPGSAKKVTLALLGQDVADSAPCIHWQQTTPWAAGPVLASFVTATLNNTYGPGCVIGGPWDGYGGGGGLFSNMELVVDGLTIQPVFNNHDPGYGNAGYTVGPGSGGINVFGLAQANIKSFSFLPLAVTVTSTIWPQWTNPASWNSGGGIIAITQWQPGLFMPDSGNNDLADIGRYTCFGAWIGIVGSEHCTWGSARVIQSNWAVLGFNPGSVCHTVTGRYLSAESCNQVFAVESAGIYSSSGPIGIQVLQTDVESVAQFVYDPNSFLYGGTNFQDNDSAAGYLSNQYTSGSPKVLFRLVQEYMSPGAVTSPQAAPGSTVAWPNYYYRDAEITLSVAGGTLSALTISGGGGAVSQVIPAAATFYRFTLPSGQAYTPTYTGVLTHTVALQ